MATIGIDLTPIQGPHRMRGVGSTVINVMRHVSDDDKSSHRFVFYLYSSSQHEALNLIDADSFPNHEVRIVTESRPLPPSIKTIRGLINIPNRLKDLLLDRRLGTKRITELTDIDVFLQFEQDIIPPAHVRSVVVAYDLIPYVLEADYLWSYDTARKAHNYSRRGALKAQMKRGLYLQTIRSAMSRAHRVIAISNHTKQDFINYIGVPTDKITVCHLGISTKKTVEQPAPDFVDCYTATSWGDVKTKTRLPTTPFLLFVGGADPRRKIADLVYAFNLLRAQGNNIHLVLAGDTMVGPNSIPNNEAREALLSSSYLDDIYMLGFVDDSTREWLYQNALVFIYPSKYEGFGLPILEAMRYGTPVITYQNSSIEEIASNKVSYADSYLSIADHVSDLVAVKEALIKREERINYVKKFSWSKAATAILKSSLER